MGDTSSSLPRREWVPKHRLVVFTLVLSSVAPDLALAVGPKEAEGGWRQRLLRVGEVRPGHGSSFSAGHLYSAWASASGSWSTAFLSPLQ